MATHKPAAGETQEAVTPKPKKSVALSGVAAGNTASPSKLTTSDQVRGGWRA